MLVGGGDGLARRDCSRDYFAPRGGSCHIGDQMDARRPGHFSMIRAFHLADFVHAGQRLPAGRARCCRFMQYLRRRDVAATSVAGSACCRWRWCMDVLDGRDRAPPRRSVAARAGPGLARRRHLLRRRARRRMAFAVGHARRLGRGCSCSTSSPAASAGWRATTSPPRRCPTRQRQGEVLRGTPIPTSLLLVALLAVLAVARAAGRRAAVRRRVDSGRLTLHPLELLFVLHGSAMISKTLRIPKP